jgi:hypothetical protein
MRFTLSAAAFTIVAFYPLVSHALSGDAGEAGASSDAAGAAGASEAQGGKVGAGGASAGKGGASGSGGSAPVPAPNLPDPGTDQSNSCSMAGPRAPWNLFGTSLALGAACLMLRRRRPR